jgi:hypothetical protein
VQPLKNAVLQGFSLKNRKSLAKTNRVLEQAHWKAIFSPVNLSQSFSFGTVQFIGQFE